MKKLAAIATLVIAGSTNAAIHTESGDAGSLLSHAQTLGAGTTMIQGSAGTDDADLYAFNWGGGAFTAETASSGDPQLFLFDGSGIGMIANDDFSNLQSRVSTLLTAGRYFLGLSGFNNDPFSTSGNIFSNTFGTSLAVGLGAANPLSGWTGEQDRSSVGAYQITFNAATTAIVTSVPEPAALALLAVSLMGLGLSRKRKN
jgi:hypothetical protein